MGSQRVGHNQATFTFTLIHTDISPVQHWDTVSIASSSQPGTLTFHLPETAPYGASLVSMEPLLRQPGQ